MNANLGDFIRMSPNKYVVKPGDTLYKIAKQFNVSVGDLMEANDLKNTTIYPEQVLIISKSVPNGGIYFVEYVVKPQDTLAKIAQETGVSTEVIGKYNDVTKLILEENQVLQIPKPLLTYTITADDTLETILAKTKLTLEEFLDLNLLNFLVPGTQILYR